LDNFHHQLELLTAAVLAIVLATLGDVVRLLHEEEHGRSKFSARRLPASLARGILMGVIATSFAQWAHEAYQVPELAGAALGGVMGYLGPTWLAFIATRVMEYFFPQKD
jgi:hypothetical protein